MKGFRFLKDAPIADMAFESWGKNEEKLFAASGLALTNAMVDSSLMQPRESKNLTLQAKSLEDLLYNFLTELLILKDKESFLGSYFETKIKKENKQFKLEAKIFGEPLDLEKHQPHNDVKAISFHQFSIKKDKNKGFVARIVLDI